MADGTVGQNIVQGRPANIGLAEKAKGPPPEPREPEPDLPEKLRGKSPGEVAAMYTELEKKLGSQGQELGQLREMLMQHQQPEGPPPDFLDQPEQAVSQIVKREMAPLAAQAFEAALDKRFPDWREEVVTADFQDWANRSKSRRMALQAAIHNDIESAVDLMEQWTERKGAREGAEAAAEEAVANDRAARRSITESGTPVSRAKGKVYSRRWLQNLQMTDPNRYRQEQSEIVRAYREGRVTD